MSLKLTTMLSFYLVSFGSSSNSESTNEDESNQVVQVPKQLFERLIDKHEELIRLIQEETNEESKEVKQAVEAKETEDIIALPISKSLKEKLKQKKDRFLKRVEIRIRRSGRKLINAFSKAGLHMGHIRKIGCRILKHIIFRKS